MANDNVVDVRGIVQTYPGVKALKGVDLKVDRGQVLGLVGENGAGKSTLIRILAGIESPVDGEVWVRGERVNFHTPTDAQRAGISVVSQEFRLVPELSVADNIFLCHEISAGGVVRARETRDRTQELLDLLELDVDPGRLVGTLSVADQQMVEIARALSREFDVLVMDEPTAALSAPEAQRLLGIVRKLASSGKAIIYVSHHLDEIFAVCDVITVFRDGNSVWNGSTSKLDESALVELMLGREPQAFVHTLCGQDYHDDDRPPRLRVRELSAPGLRRAVDIKVHPGEVLALAGLAGSGRMELMGALAGDVRAKSGAIEVDGVPVSVRSPFAARSAGIFMLSEDRKQEGIVPHLDVTENTMISKPWAARKGLAKWFTLSGLENSTFMTLRKRMRIRVPHGQVLIGSLSGGNQQKVLLARAVESQARVMLLNEPTRGVDVGAKVEIYELIESLAEQGAGVVVSSSDIPEVVAVANRCVVFHAGRPVGELAGDNITEDNITALALGQFKEVSHA
ncbi:sugar ABC transporter ATP-binding protein [Demequina sp. NBRC 110052]|uniref:sugar ABC transporter ATP-binding protein n=1 Tax=Demequina sp. NBRC 110052 TaxID=1570341 RepID=UPI0009FE94F3|nr:sugar ABC transporter ATP-binding protein [Demequina sp. NBRC 110052]